jgi:hypothetical protein
VYDNGFEFGLANGLTLFPRVLHLTGPWRKYKPQPQETMTNVPIPDPQHEALDVEMLPFQPIRPPGSWLSDLGIPDALPKAGSGAGTETPAAAHQGQARSMGLRRAAGDRLGQLAFQSSTVD